MHMHTERTSGVGAPEGLVKIYAGKLFDPHTLQLLPQRVEEVVVGFGIKTIDLRDATVLPGFVDAHVHMFLHPYDETSWEEQLTKESLVERTCGVFISRILKHSPHPLCHDILRDKAALLHAYGDIAFSDLGTEGAEDADIHLRKCISGPNAIILGPRYFCANRAIIASGSYGPQSSLHLHQDGVEGITGAQFVDGEIECVKAVRKQIGAGADWIKVYADYRPRTRMADVNSKVPRTALQTFTISEVKAMVSAARQLGVKVAAHAQTWRADLLPENGGFDTLEHGNNIPDDLADRIVQSKITWVPTLSVFYTQDHEKAAGGVWDTTSRNFQKAIRRGMTNIACGGDTGPFPHGDNALEMKLMVRLGAQWRYVLRWATLGGWECIRSASWEGTHGAARLSLVDSLLENVHEVGDNEVPFGVLERGFAADIIATIGDLEKDFESAVDKSSIAFVMKGGRVVKRNGVELV